MSDLPKPGDSRESVPEEEDLDLGPELDDELPEGDEEGELAEREEGEPPAGAEPQPITAPRRSQSQRLRERLEDERRQRQELERRLANLESAPRTQAPDPATAARAEAEEWARVQEMSPAEAARWALEKGRREFGLVLQRQQLELKEQLDRQRYEDQARTSKKYRDYQPRVEALLAAEYARGNLAATREAILRYLVGDDDIKRGTADAANQRRTARQRVASQETRPAGSRSDDAARPRPADDSYEAALARIGNRPLW